MLEGSEQGRDMNGLASFTGPPAAVQRARVWEQEQEQGGRRGFGVGQAQRSAGSQWKGVMCAPLAVVEEPGNKESKWLKDLRFLLSLQSHGRGSKSELRREGGVRLPHPLARRDGEGSVAGSLAPLC